MLRAKWHSLPVLWSLPRWKEIIVSLNSSIICTLRPLIPMTIEMGGNKRSLILFSSSLLFHCAAAKRIFKSTTSRPPLTLSRVRVPNHNLVLGVVLAGDLGRFRELARVPDDVVWAQGGQRLPSGSPRSRRCCCGHRRRWGGGAQQFTASLMVSVRL